MKKRILPIVLVLVMLLSLLPAQVFAASYTFDPNATIFTQNYTTETPRPNNLGDYFTVTTTPLSTANKTAAWNTGNNVLAWHGVYWRQSPRRPRHGTWHNHAGDALCAFSHAADAL